MIDFILPYRKRPTAKVSIFAMTFEIVLRQVILIISA